MLRFLRFQDSGPYHARMYNQIPRSWRDTLEIAASEKLVTHGKFGYTLTMRGYRAAFPDFTTGDGSC